MHSESGHDHGPFHGMVAVPDLVANKQKRQISTQSDIYNIPMVG